MGKTNSSHLQRLLIGIALVAVLAREAISQVAVVPLHVGQKSKLLQEELVANEALEGLAVVGGSEVNLQKERNEIL